jgi:FdrA protein
MVARVEVRKDSYKDSVRLLEATRALLATSGAEWGWAVMATPANLETLAAEGFSEGLDDAGANDLVLAVRASSAEVASAALDAAITTLFASREGGGLSADDHPAAADLREATKAHPAANVGVVSVPGPYAALECHKALTAGLDVLLFSDNVPVADEVALKQRARRLGRLVMGPGAGTAVLGGAGLGFANRVRPGRVGVVAAAGTGAQEVMSLLSRWGGGVSHVIGVGGRDLSPAVGGLMAESALRALDAHDGTAVILLVSKPPSPEVAERLLQIPTKPTVAALIGLRGSLPTPDHVTVCTTLEQGAALALGLVGGSVPDLAGSLADDVATWVTALSRERQRLVGLFSGGTLCYEAMTIAVPHLGPIHSNTPLDKSWGIDAAGPGAHVCLDLGEEEYTQGRPHPMIDPEARIELLAGQIDDPSVAVVLLDVVIGDGSHPSPASLLAPVAAKVVESGAAVVSYVLGTDDDPQGFAGQQALLREAGCIVTETAARAALAATAMVLRDPALVYAEQ